MVKYSHSAKLIASVRAKSGFTQLDFAKLLGVDAQFVSNMERGESALPAKRAIKIAALVSPDKLLKAYLQDVETLWLSESGE